MASLFTDMSMRIMAVAALLGTFSVGSAHAAPFCLNLPGGGSQCIYADGESCARDANRATNGSCTVNPRELRLEPGTGGDYCVVSGEGATMCGYADPTSCAHEASLHRSVCAKAPTREPQQLPNTFAPNAGR